MRYTSEPAYLVTAALDGAIEQCREVAAALSNLIEPTRAEPGCRFHQPTVDISDPGVFLLLEIYDDEDAYKAHGESEHFKRHALEESLPLLESRECSFYETLD